jgi:tol-pal system protein YbgF
MRGLSARLLLVGALLAPFAAPSGAHAALFGSDDEKLNTLRSQIEANEKVLEDRLAKLESSATDRRAILDLSGQLDQLRSDLAHLRGQVEVLTNQIETAEKRQKDLYLDIDTRLRKLEQAREQAAASATQPAAGGGETPATPAETKAYEAALNQFKLGNYPLAISAFEGFLVTYPSSSLAPSAQYWIGNAYYAQHDYKKAIASQQKLLSAWPDSAKAPDGMLNIASSQEASGDRRGARKTLEDLLDKYPTSPAATSAKQRLQGLRR